MLGLGLLEREGAGEISVDRPRINTDDLDTGEASEPRSACVSDCSAALDAK
jgi:hypothetical protein